MEIIDIRRRRFMALCSALGGGALVSGANAVPIEFDQMCRSPSPYLRVNRSPSNDLIIAGTRLFKEGFLDDVLVAYGTLSGKKSYMLGGGCDDGVAGVRLGAAALGGICCPIEHSPARDMRGLTVANDVKVIVANPSVSVRDINLAQVRGLLTGQINDWQQLGGPSQAIPLVVYDHCPDYLEPVRRRFLENKPMWSPHALVVKTDQKHLETISKFPGAVGINSWILAEPFVTKGRLKVLAVEGVLPTLENAASGRYPIVGPLTLIFKQWDEAAFGPFFRFVYSSLGQAYIRPRAVPVSAQQAGFDQRNIAT